MVTFTFETEHKKKTHHSFGRTRARNSEVYTLRHTIRHLYAEIWP